MTPADGVEYELVDSGCFIDDDKDVSGVETLETVFGVGRESVGVSFRREFESCAGQVSRR